jgi:hypothetical protein
VRRSEAETLLGPPSLIVDHGTVLCYAPDDPAAGWLFVDSPVVPVRRYQAGEGSYTIDDETVPLVRSLRLSSRPFEDGLILTLYGKVLRWGPGSWVLVLSGISGKTLSVDVAAFDVSQVGAFATFMGDVLASVEPVLAESGHLTGMILRTAGGGVIRVEVEADELFLNEVIPGHSTEGRER